MRSRNSTRKMRKTFSDDKKGFWIGCLINTWESTISGRTAALQNWWSFGLIASNEFCKYSYRYRRSWCPNGRFHTRTKELCRQLVFWHILSGHHTCFWWINKASIKFTKQCDEYLYIWICHGKTCSWQFYETILACVLVKSLFNASYYIHLYIFHLPVVFLYKYLMVDSQRIRQLLYLIT